MSRIFYDGYNLALEHGTGVATYARMLTRAAHDLGHNVSVVYGPRYTPTKRPLLNEVGFYDAREPERGLGVRQTFANATDFLACFRSIRPLEVHFSGAVLRQQFAAREPVADHFLVARRLFSRAHGFFQASGRFATVEFDDKPDIFHWTFQLPLRSAKSLNIYTIHDLVPLRLPYASLDHKRATYRMLRQIASKADHIITVSESSKADIIKLLGVSEARITNTYQSVEFPKGSLERSESEVADHLAGAYGLEYGRYMLFFGAMEPKKNLLRIMEAYLAANVDIPLVIISSGGWKNDSEMKILSLQRELRRERLMKQSPEALKSKRDIKHMEYAPIRTLVTLIRGARAVLFPSLYEGFGLPVLEAMTLGTPVVTSRVSSLPEIAGEAAILVDPYDMNDITRAIVRIAKDDDLRDELIRRGKQQATLFSVEKYKERVGALYSRLL